jgi:hypothetical protein
MVDTSFCPYADDGHPQFLPSMYARNIACQEVKYGEPFYISGDLQPLALLLVGELSRLPVVFVWTLALTFITLTKSLSRLTNVGKTAGRLDQVNLTKVTLNHVILHYFFFYVDIYKHYFSEYIC